MLPFYQEYVDILGFPTIKRTRDGSIIPHDLGNIDYQDYLQWVDAGRPADWSDAEGPVGYASRSANRSDVNGPVGL